MPIKSSNWFMLAFSAPSYGAEGPLHLLRSRSARRGVRRSDRLETSLPDGYPIDAVIGDDGMGIGETGVDVFLFEARLVVED